jgi:hypothetical protein
MRKIREVLRPCCEVSGASPLIALGLVGMAKAFEEQRQQPAVASLMFVAASCR